MSSDAIYATVCKRTKKAFGFSVSLHRFRHAAGTLWSIEDPENIRGTKDLLAHVSYDKTTETHYNEHAALAETPRVGTRAYVSWCATFANYESAGQEFESLRARKLPPEQVDAVVAAGRDALRANEVYRRFLASLAGTESTPYNTR